MEDEKKEREIEVPEKEPVQLEELEKEQPVEIIDQRGMHPNDGDPNEPHNELGSDPERRIIEMPTEHEGVTETKPMVQPRCAWCNVQPMVPSIFEVKLDNKGVHVFACSKCGAMINCQTILMEQPILQPPQPSIITPGMPPKPFRPM